MIEGDEWELTCILVDALQIVTHTVIIFVTGTVARTIVPQIRGFARIIIFCCVRIVVAGR